SPVGIREKWFPLLQNVQNHIYVDQDSHCLASRSFRIVSSSMAESSETIPTRLSRTASLLTVGLVSRAMFLPFLVMNISCFIAISKYLPRLVLNSVAVTIIIRASFMVYSMSFFIFIIRKSHEIVKKPYGLFRTIQREPLDEYML